MKLDAVQESAVIPNEKGILETTGRGFCFVTPFARQQLFYILYENEYLCDSSYRVTREYVDCLMLIHVMEGCMDLHYRGRDYQLREGSLAYLDLRYAHDYGAAGGNLRTEQMLLNGNAARAYADLLQQQSGPVFRAHAGVLRSLDALRENLRNPDPDDHQISVQIHGLLAALAGDRKKPESGMTLTAKAYMAEHFREMISLDEVADAVALNKSYFSRQFRKETGFSPWEYLIRVRLKEAFRRLSETEESVEIIAESCGFASASHFIRTFKKETGLTPLLFRKQFS